MNETVAVALSKELTNDDKLKVCLITDYDRLIHYYSGEHINESSFNTLWEQTSDMLERNYPNLKSGLERDRAMSQLRESFRRGENPEL